MVDFTRLMTDLFRCRGKGAERQGTRPFVLSLLEDELCVRETREVVFVLQIWNNRAKWAENGGCVREWGRLFLKFLPVA